MVIMLMFWLVGFRVGSSYNVSSRQTAGKEKENKEGEINNM